MNSWSCLVELSLRPSFMFLMRLLGWVSVYSESWRFYYEFLDLSCEAGPSAQLFSLMTLLEWIMSNLKSLIFLGWFLLSWTVEDPTMSSWICLLKLGLRPSFFFLMCLLGWTLFSSKSLLFLDGFLCSLKVEDHTMSLWMCLLKLGLRPSSFS